MIDLLMMLLSAFPRPMSATPAPISWVLGARMAQDNSAATKTAPVAAVTKRATAEDRIELDGQLLSHSSPGSMREVLLYHKPMSEVTTRADPDGRPTVFDRLPTPRAGRWVVIGRLDVNTTGLLLFTTDGALANRLMHPSSQLEREYLVRVRGVPGPQTLASLKSGLMFGM